MPEIWKPVVGYEGLYEVSNLGQVRRVFVKAKLSTADLLYIKQAQQQGISQRAIAKTLGVSQHAIQQHMKPRHYKASEPHILKKQNIGKGYNTGKGYHCVFLCKNAKYTMRYVHHLVAEAFLGPRHPGIVINHINGIKTDNRDINLEYATHGENAYHAWCMGFTSIPTLRNGKRLKIFDITRHNP